jgi:DNA-binding XRE family transcriptional regulator
MGGSGVVVVRRRVALAGARKAAGYTQEGLAAALHVDRSTVIRWEAGDHAPLPYLWPKLARLLGQSQEQLRELIGDGSDIRPEADGTSVDSEDMMRELLHLFTIIEVLVTVPDTDGQLDLLGYSFNNSGRLDSMAVDDYAMLNEHLWRVFVLSKSKGAVLPLVRSQLDMLTVSLSQSRGLSTHQRLCELVSGILQLAGEIFFDANKYTDAAHCYTLAATASKEADAFDLWACAMTRHAFIGIYERRFEKAESILELAARLARRGDKSLPTRYWVSAVQAQAFAGLGKLDACRRALDVAEQVQGLAGDVSNGGWLRFDGSRLAEERGSCYVQLRRPDLAELTLSDALWQNLSARRRGSVLIDLAMMGVQRGDVSQLVTYADAALEIAVQTGSGFIGRKLYGLRDYLAPLLGNSQVRQLNQQIMTLSENSIT